MPRSRQHYVQINEELEDFEALPQPVIAYGHDLEKGNVLPFHSHRRGQLVYASSGIMIVTTRSASYTVPPQRAVWMPPGIEHQISAQSPVKLRTLYIDSRAAMGLPDEVYVLQVTLFLRELIVAAVAAGREIEPDSPQSRVIAVILDQIPTQPIASLKLPLPSDPRLSRVTQALIDNPADSRDLDEFAKEVGASKRTLVRLFPSQTGMTFSEWRQQRRLSYALELLITGESVTAIALETGYDNTSAFIAMFRRCLGTTPMRYMKAIKS
jgi:AraC-like DNA-binding protein/mannose-6-phosphate isomerase-like protein (cupin superfamily)